MARLTRKREADRSVSTRPRRVKKARKSLFPFAGKTGARPVHLPPPVMVRNVVQDAPTQESPTKKHRRRYDVALGIPGAEVRLPSLPALRLSWRILSALCAIILAGLLVLVWSRPEFRVTEAEIVGLQRISPAEVNTVIDLADTPIFMVDPKQIHQVVQKAFPEMAAITVEVGLPASVIITVDERVPALAWQEDDRELWIDEDGVAFPARGDSAGLVKVKAKGFATAPMPTSTDREEISVESELAPVELALPVPYIDPQIVSAVQTVSAYMPKNTNLVYDSTHGLGWREKRGITVYFGNYVKDIELKLKFYTTILDRLKRIGITPLIINIENIHAPYVRVEQ